MDFTRPSVLLLAALVDAPALYGAFVAHDLDPATALLRFLIAVIVCGLMATALRSLTRVYHDAVVDAREQEAAAARAAEAEAADDLADPLDRRRAA